MKILKQKTVDPQLDHVTEEMYKQNLELAERSKTLLLLRQIDEIVLSAVEDTRTVSESIAKLLVNQGFFNVSAVYVKHPSTSVVVLQGLVSRFNLDSEADSIVNSYLSNFEAGSFSPFLKDSVTSGQVYMLSSFQDLSPRLGAVDNAKLLRDSAVKTIFICPLKSSNRFLGFLLLGSPYSREEITNYQRSLIDRLTGVVSIALENNFLYEELQAATERLQVQNKKLQELDQTKDEFISMASHQLLTPLTAIKGYLSMVLDGTAKATPKGEKDMVESAFDGAQKMVYLVTDLLNVSRLRTGKFVIVNKPTNLADLVEGEVKQLKKTADVRHLELIYNKPVSFPSLNLDETKVRQVVMNFIDNAIYYTPPQGKVTVQLGLTDKTVTFNVTDTGVGVPRDVQPQLFSKFYRADNAKKMRPDGTGLGLYMAKKVITAQGGAIIFRSEEGKGSSFGFSFPRRQMEVK